MALGLARIVRALAGLIALIIVVAIVLFVLGANQSNAVVSAIHDAGAVAGRPVQESVLDPQAEAGHGRQLGPGCARLPDRGPLHRRPARADDAAPARGRGLSSGPPSAASVGPGTPSGHSRSRSGRGTWPHGRRAQRGPKAVRQMTNPTKFWRESMRELAYSRVTKAHDYSRYRPHRLGRALRPLAAARRPKRARRARHPLPAARPQARPALRRRPRAVRGPASGRQPRPGQGRRSVRRRARDRLLLVRRSDHPRRAQALLPRPRAGPCTFRAARRRWP